jgi:PST family polysaccharide transporter
VKGVFWTAASNWGDQLARLLVFAILSRLLDPVAFGLVALALVLVGFTEVIAEQGLTDALVQRKHLEADHLDTAFWMGIGFGGLLALLLGALAVPIAVLLDQRPLAPVLVALALVIPIASSSLVQRAILTREMKFRSLALRTLISIGLGSVVGVSAALLGFGVWSLVAQSLTVQTTGALVLWRVTGWRPRLNFSYSHFRELLSFGKHVVGFKLLNYSNRNADNFIIGSVLGPASLGFYVVGYRILRLMIQITSSLIDKVAFPLYSRLQDDPNRFRRAYYKSSSFAALTAFPAFIGLLILAPEIVSVMFGSKWAKSVPVMQVLAVFGIIRSLSYLNSSTMTALGKPSWRLVITGITAVLNIGAFLLAARHGIVAVAIAVLAVGYLTAPISYWAVNRLVPIDARTYFRHIKGPLLGSVALACVMVGLKYLLGDVSAALTLIVVSTAGAVVYIAAIRLLAPPLAVEVRELVRRAVPTPRFARPAGLSSRR